MSKLDSNGHKPSKNYFSNTEETYDLVQIVLNELYSKEISDLAVDLLKNGGGTLFEIQSRLKLSYENIKNYLIIMLQNNLIQKKEISRNDVKNTSYEINLEQILNILFFPRSLSFIEKKFGEYARLIFEQFIEFGVLTLKQIIEQIQNIKNNGNNLEQIKSNVLDILIKLYSNNLICYSEKPSEGENYYKINNSDLKKRKRGKSDKEKEKEIIKASDKKKGGKKKKGSKKEEKDEDYTINKGKNMKLIEDDEEDEEENIIKDSKQIEKNEEFYENNTKNNMHFYINFHQINVEFQADGNSKNPAPIIGCTYSLRTT